MAMDALILFFTLTSACLWRNTPVLSLSVPERVSALEGSCVVIPCSFSPVSSTQVMEVLLKKSSSVFKLKRTVFTSHRSDVIHPDYRNRVSLAGNISSGDCSINISRIRKEDQNTYDLQLREPGQRSPTAETNIHVSVLSTPDPPELTDPGPVKEGQRVTLNCSVRLSCPSERPGLVWRWERGQQDGSSVHGDTELQREPGQFPLLQSSLTFTVPQHTNPRVRCQVTYTNNRRSSAVREILVHFPPRDVTVQVQSVSVQVGGMALLGCTCKADPPVSEYQWTSVQSGNTVILSRRTPTVRIYNITRDTRLQCTATNRLGQATSRLTALNVQYAPVILRDSSCEWDGSLLSCVCVVDSNPRPAVTWSVNSSHLPDSYNVSYSYSNFILTSTLRGMSDPGLPVECYVINSLGNHSRLLFESPNGQQKSIHVSLTSTLTLTEVIYSSSSCFVTGGVLWPLIASAASVVFLLLCLLMFFCCFRTNRPTYRPPAIHAENLAIYRERAPLYVNCSEVTNIYTNGSYQLIYQNDTPIFIRTTQTHKRQRRAARRQRAQKEIVMSADSDTAVYVEVI
ncbi:myelin-associated glycoprotein-like isoform X2 [Triplophysa rosa]|uniref:myelin-associated glycoprotein-like isoform X2 n=1 Tax=Triplophysa rosa TaxID=992332 RepID=UPI002545F3B0|nr:myelin-associated glycoprotein-like isoform X2 [Triplophysa rosa]